MRNMGRKTWTAATIALATFVQPIIAFAQIAQNAEAPLPVPEPETLALLAIGAAALIVSRWSKRK